MRRIRKRFRVLVLMAIVATIVVPVGFALSLRPEPIVTRARTGGPSAAYTAALPVAAAMPAVIFTAGEDTRGAFEDPIPDAARLFLAGAILFGLAAVVRKAA